jgi:hypothetical protein
MKRKRRVAEMRRKSARGASSPVPDSGTRHPSQDGDWAGSLGNSGHADFEGEDRGAAMSDIRLDRDVDYSPDLIRGRRR